MRVRRQDADGDYTFGQGSANFLINSSAEVAQTILTRLRLFEGEWYLDETAGTPWNQSVLGKSTKNMYDMVIQQRIATTSGVSVNGIQEYASTLDKTTRRLTVTATVQTIFSAEPVKIEVVL